MSQAKLKVLVSVVKSCRASRNRAALSGDIERVKSATDMVDAILWAANEAIAMSGSRDPKEFLVGTEEDNQLRELAHLEEL